MSDQICICTDKKRLFFLEAEFVNRMTKFVPD